MVDKIQSPLIDTSLAPIKGVISNSDYVFVRGADESIEKVLVSDLLAGTAGAIRIRGEADMDNASTTSTSVVIIGDPNNATMKQGVAPVDTSPNGVSYVVKTSQSGVQTQISGTVQTVFDGDQIIWSGSKWSILALGNAVTSVDNQTGAVNLEDKYYWTGNKPNIGDIPNLKGTLDSKYSPTNKPTPAEIGAKANSYIPDWEEITNKPDTSTRWPSFAEVTSKPTTATRWPTFNEVTNKPDTATRWPAFSEVTGKPTYYPTTWASVAAKPEQATRWPTWSEVTGKPTTFAPSAHTHTAAQVSGLGSAATRDVGTTAGNVMEVGAFGIGDGKISSPNTAFAGQVGFWNPHVENTDVPCIYGSYWTTGGPGGPGGAGGAQIAVQAQATEGVDNLNMWARVVTQKAGGQVDITGSWRVLTHSGNIQATTGQSTIYPMSQKAVTDQLATKAALSHTHPWSQVTGKPSIPTTASDIGAVSKTGDVMSGDLTIIPKVTNGSSALGLLEDPGNNGALVKYEGYANELQLITRNDGTNHIKMKTTRFPDSPIIFGGPIYEYDNKVYTEGYKPTKADVGLSNVPNYTISNATNDPSTNKFASTAAVYSVSQRVATLEGSSTGGDVYGGTDPKNTEFPIGTYLVGEGSDLLPNTHTVLYTYSSESDGFHYSTTTQGSTSKQLNGVWACRGKLGGSSDGALFQRIE